MDETKETRDMTGWSEEEIERGETFVEGFIRACKEVRAMRDGLIPKPTMTWREMLDQIDREAEEEERLECEATQAKKSARD